VILQTTSTSSYYIASEVLSTAVDVEMNSGNEEVRLTLWSVELGVDMIRNGVRPQEIMTWS
jgi:hypothetical protein